MNNRNNIKIDLFILISLMLVYNAASQQHKVVFANENLQNPVIELLSDKIEISNSYSRASVKGSLNAGGLVGRVSGDAQIVNTYSSGWVEGNVVNSGGLIGSFTGNMETIGSYWDIESSGLSQSASGIGKTKSTMTSPGNSTTYEGWNFQQVWHSDVNGINGGYPYISADLPQMYKLQLSSNPILSGILQGSGSFAPKTHVGITAHPNVGFQFSNWTSSGNVLTQNAQTVVIIPPSDYNIIANFTLISGVEDVSAPIKVFPNPVNDFLLINNVSDCKNVLISDIYGRVIQTYDINIGGFYNTSHLLPGYYLVSLIDKNGRIMNFPILKY